MADLSRIQADLPTMIVGATSTGSPTTPVAADVNGNMLVKDFSDGILAGILPAVAGLTGGSVTTAAPTYSTATIDALSLTTAGNLRVDGSSVTQPVSGTVTQIHTDIVPAAQNITALDVSTTSLVGANGQVFYFGTPTAGSTAVFVLSSINAVQIQSTVIGAGGTLVVETTMDGTSWVRPNVYQPSTQSYTNGLTAPFIAIVNTAGCAQIRVRSTVSWTGNASILVHETLNQRPITIADALPPGANTIGGVNQSGAWTNTVTQATGTNLHTVVDSGTIAATQSGTWTVNSHTQDGAGAAITSINSQLETADILNTSSQYRAQSVTTTAAEALGAATILANRKFISITPTNGTIYWGTSNTVTTATGSPLIANSTLFLSVGVNIHIFVIAAATTDARILEAS